MFRFTRKPSSGSHSQYLAKITHLVHCGYMEVILCRYNTDIICSWAIKCLCMVMNI